MQAGELSPRTWADYQSIMDMLATGMGKHRVVTALEPQNFAALKNKLARQNGPVRMCTVIQVIRCAFKHAYESGLLDQPILFGPGFKRTSKKTLRLHRAKQGPKLFSADAVRRMLNAAGPLLRAMILLGINAGFGNSDCGNLPLSVLDLERGWVDSPQPKTEIPRRCPLWLETVTALKEALAQRPEPKKTEHTALVFITKYGGSWSKDDSAGPITQEMRKLLNNLGINGHKNFYTLRHTFRIVIHAQDSLGHDPFPSRTYAAQLRLCCTENLAQGLQQLVAWIRFRQKGVCARAASLSSFPACSQSTGSDDADVGI